MINTQTICENTQNTAIHDFVAQVETIYKGLGLPVLYGTLSILANKSVLFISGRGSGKTRIIKSIPEIDEVYTKNWDSFTYGELSNHCETLEDNDLLGVNNKHLVFKVEEFSTLSEYHRQIFLSVCSKIVSDGNYSHITEMSLHLNFENCKLTMLIAIQPKMYSLLCYRYPQWECMSYDRFTKFLLLNPLREGSTIEIPFVPTLPRKKPLCALLPDNVDLSKLVDLFKGHVSEGRALLYAKDYSTAMARMAEKTEVQQEDVDLFYKLFSPYLGSFSQLQHRDELGETIAIASGDIELLTEISKHLDGITKEQLSRALFVTTRQIERSDDLLLDKGLIRRVEDKYFLSTELEQFFNWYKDTFSFANVGTEQATVD